MKTRHTLAALFAALLLVMAPSPSSAEEGPGLYGLFLLDQAEYGFDGADNPLRWDLTSWVGGDWNRIWLKSEGELPSDGSSVSGEAQLLYSRLIAPFWELQVGVRGDLSVEDQTLGRGHLVLGLEGMVPYLFEVEPALFVSQRGDVSMRLRATHDLFVTQRLIAQSSAEVNLAVQSVPEFGVGAGLGDLEVGLRLRYEFAREFAPYVGVSYEQSFFETAELRSAGGEAPRVIRGVAGLRLWF
jgi:copper resistance protein B